MLRDYVRYRFNDSSFLLYYHIYKDIIIMSGLDLYILMKSVINYLRSPFAPMISNERILEKRVREDTLWLYTYIVTFSFKLYYFDSRIRGYIFVRAANEKFKVESLDDRR